MIPLAPPPPDASRSGPARATIEAVADQVAAEERACLDVSTRSLRLTSAGRVLAGGEAYPIEEGGLRALLMHYTHAFPRLTPSALLMRPGVLAEVFRAGLEDHAPQLPADVRLRFRRGPGGLALYGATPTLAPPYDVDAVARDLADAIVTRVGPGALALGWPEADVLYQAADSALTVSLSLGSNRGAHVPPWLRVIVTDGYPCRIAVTCGVGSKDLGDPAPDVTIRRRTKGDLLRPADGLYRDFFAAKIAAVPAWVRAKTGA